MSPREREREPACSRLAVWSNKIDLCLALNIVRKDKMKSDNYNESIFKPLRKNQSFDLVFVFLYLY